MDKVNVRMFVLEQIVKMRCMSDCSAEDLVKEAKTLEQYLNEKIVDSEYMRVLQSLGTHKYVDLSDFKTNEA